MGKCAREKAKREFSVKTVIDKHLQVYEKLV